MGYQISDGITQSMLQSFLRCRQRSQYETDGWRYGMNKVSANRGTLWHKALELHYQNQLNIVSLTDCYEKAFKDTESSVKFKTLWQHYVKYWNKSDAKFEWRDLELEFKQKYSYTSDITGIKHEYLLRGKIDGVVKIGKNWYIFETKTKSRIDDDYIMNALEFDFQTLFYITNMRARGVNVVGVKYNVIRDPNIKDLETAVRKDPSHFFKRFEHTYSEKVLKNFQSDLAEILHEFRKLKEGQLRIYKNPTACYSGGMTCPFIHACASAGNMAGFEKKELFQELGKEAWLEKYSLKSKPSPSSPVKKVLPKPKVTTRSLPVPVSRTRISGTTRS